MTTYRARTSLFALATVMATPAFAQASGDSPAPAMTSSSSRTTAYPASFFAQYAPRNALDIARQVPGFQIDFGDQSIRGFSGAAGNVVINGQRPSSKSENLNDILQKIPASRVVRVEIGPGDIFGSDYSTRNQVLNIIMSAEGGLDGNVTGSLRRLYTGAIVPDGSISALIRRGASTINLSAGFNNNVNHEEGTDTIRDLTPPLASGDLLEHRRKFNSYHDFNPYISGSWSLERAADKSIHLNARWSPGQFDLYQRNRVTVTGEDPRDDNLIQDYDNDSFELGGDITRPLAGGAIKLVGLATRRNIDNFDSYILRDGIRSEGAAQVGGFQQTQKAERDETIGRLSWSRQNIAGFSFEAGFEGAFNTLDNTTELFDVEEDGSLTPHPLPVTSATVKEKRGEGYVNVGRQLNPNLRVDAGVRYEFSHLTVDGDAEADRKLQFWKPSLTIDWKPVGKWHAQFSVKRTVAQLNFFDFVTAAELSTDRVNAGNANLEPQRTWEFRATADHPLLGDGQVKLDLGYDNISMFQDRVLICDPDHPGDASFCFDAPGNIGTGKRSFAALTVDAPLDKLVGISGLRLKFFGQLQRTRVEDPISGEKRNFSDFYPKWQWNVSLRRDHASWSYGFEVSDRDSFTFYRTDEFDTNFNTQPYATAFVEYRPDKRTSITFDIDNAINTHGARDRQIYFPNRADLNPFIVDEFRERNRHLNLGLTFKRTFGGAGTQASAGQGN